MVKMEIDTESNKVDEDFLKQFENLYTNTYSFPQTYYIVDSNEFQKTPTNIDEISVGDTLYIDSNELYKISYLQPDSEDKFEPVLYIDYSEVKGRCLITLVPLYKEASLGLFMGKTQNIDDMDNDYVLTCEKGNTTYYVDPSFSPDEPNRFDCITYPHCCAGIMNDQRYNLYAKNNCYINDDLIVTTKRHINSYEEIFINYGNEYWNARMTIDPLLQNEIVLYRKWNEHTGYLRIDDFIELESNVCGTEMFQIISFVEPYSVNAVNVDTNERTIIIDLNTELWIYHRSYKLFDADTHKLQQSPKMIFDYCLNQ